MWNLKHIYNVQRRVLMIPIHIAFPICFDKHHLVFVIVISRHIESSLCMYVLLHINTQSSSLVLSACMYICM